MTKKRPLREVVKNATSKGVTVAVNSTANTTTMSHLRKKEFWKEGRGAFGRGRGGIGGQAGERGWWPQKLKLLCRSGTFVMKRCPGHDH